MLTPGWNSWPDQQRKEYQDRIAAQATCDPAASDVSSTRKTLQVRKRKAHKLPPGTRYPWGSPAFWHDSGTGKGLVGRSERCNVGFRLAGTKRIWRAFTHSGGSSVFVPRLAECSQMLVQWCVLRLLSRCHFSARRLPNVPCFGPTVRSLLFKASSLHLKKSVWDCKKQKQVRQENVSFFPSWSSPEHQTTRRSRTYGFSKFGGAKFFNIVSCSFVFFNVFESLTFYICLLVLFVFFVDVILVCYSFCFGGDCSIFL